MTWLRDRTWRWWLSATASLCLAYALSVGPVFWVIVHSGAPGSVLHDVWEIYAPLEVLGKIGPKVFGRDALRWYVKLWVSDAELIATRNRMR